MPALLPALLASAPPYPRRVVCLTEETTEVLYRIGAGELVVGVSGFTVRPPEARRKPRISSFLAADADRIAALRPDVVLGFSDLQADIARDLVRRGLPVFVMNQADELSAGLARLAEGAAALPRRPRAFFEEWPEPLISGIRWVSELLELCGADDVCRETRSEQGAQGRIFAPAEVARRDPELVIASWCGKKAVRARIAGRSGWADVRAVRDDQLYEVKSTIILQPGPAALTEGAAELARIVAAVARGEQLPPHREGDLRRG